jgi:hypothetical protein
MSPLTFRETTLCISLTNLNLPEKLSPIETPQEAFSPNPINQALASYETYNLLPVKQVPGTHGGFLITVKINPHFNPLDVDLEAQEFLKAKMEYDHAKMKYESELKVYEKELAEYNDGLRIRKPYAPFKTLILYKYGYDENVIEKCEKRKKFPSYSTNLESKGDPQGDINWLFLLPVGIQKLLGISKDGNHFTFPDIVEINGCIDEINSLAKTKLGIDSFIPLKLKPVNGVISNAEYIKIFEHGFVPVAKPKVKSSWFYHDLLYHVIGLFLTPRHVLLKALKFTQLVKSRLNTDGIENLVRHLDRMTSYCLRLSIMDYIKSHSELEFYCLGYEPFSKPTKYFKEVIIEFAFFALFWNIDDSADTLIEELNRKDYYLEVHRKTLLRLDISMLMNLLLADKEGHLRDILESVVS